MDIGQVSRLSGFSPSALRYYEERGLIQSCGRKGLRRLFDERVLQRLALISLGQKAGFSLEDIGQMLASGAIDRPRLLARAQEIEQRIAELTTLRDSLRHVAHCPAPDHFHCPRFLQLLAQTGV